jgi:hypothetical protein
VQGPLSKFNKELVAIRPNLLSPLLQTLKTTNPVIYSPEVLPSKWVKRINASNVDIVHLHWFQGEMLSIADIGRIEKPIIWTLHDMWGFCGAEHYSNDDRWRDGYRHNNRPPHESGFDLNRWTWNRKRGLKSRTAAGASMVPESLRIINRPDEIEARLVPGHWEGDLIKGAFNRSSVGTLVERKIRFVILCKMDGNGAEAALDSFTRQMRRLPVAVRKSMTYDRGSEMACHPELARRLKIDIWFCDPHAPCVKRRAIMGHRSGCVSQL